MFIRSVFVLLMILVAPSCFAVQEHVGGGGGESGGGGDHVRLDVEASRKFVAQNYENWISLKRSRVDLAAFDHLLNAAQFSIVSSIMDEGGLQVASELRGSNNIELSRQFWLSLAGGGELRKAAIIVHGILKLMGHEEDSAFLVSDLVARELIYTKLFGGTNVSLDEVSVTYSKSVKGSTVTLRNIKVRVLDLKENYSIGTFAFPVENKKGFADGLCKKLGFSQGIGFKEKRLGASSNGRPMVEFAESFVLVRRASQWPVIVAELSCRQ